MSSRVFVCVLTARTVDGDAGLRRMMTAKVNSGFVKAQRALGIDTTRRVVQEVPYTLELESKLSKAAGWAYRTTRKKSFERWIEDFEDKLDDFDTVEQLHRGVDYEVSWDDRTL